MWVEEILVAARFRLDLPCDARRLAARLQDIEKPFAADAYETVIAGVLSRALEAHLDVIPMIERGVNLGRAFSALRTHRRVGESHDLAKSVVRPIAFDHANAMRRNALPHQQAEIKARGTAADRDDAHGRVHHAANIICLILKYIRTPFLVNGAAETRLPTLKRAAR